MKFIASKKLSDNATLRAVMTWMVVLLILSLGLSLAAKSIDYGTAPSQWKNTIMGNEAEFTDPIGFNDLLLSVHTDLFGLILTFILITSLIVRTSHSVKLKMGFLGLGLGSLLLYPAALLSVPWNGAGSVMTSASAFIVFHLLMIIAGVDLLIALIKRRL